VLTEWLRERKIPGDLMAWTEGFCNGRKAPVMVSDYKLPILKIEHVGISQGSPFPPIL
jgi:hypothetical protein